MNLEEEKDLKYNHYVQLLNRNLFEQALRQNILVTQSHLDEYKYFKLVLIFYFIIFTTSLRNIESHHSTLF